MPSPPLYQDVYSCPHCAQLFTIRWIHPWSWDDYVTDRINCPYCGALLQNSNLIAMGIDRDFAGVQMKTAEPIKRNKAPGSKGSDAPLDDDQTKSFAPKTRASENLEKPVIVNCPPLMEACTLELYTKNIFRVAGLPVDATSKEIARQAQKLQMLEEMGGGDTATSPAFALAVAPTSHEIRAALSRMKESQHRLVDEFFWYWPEEFGVSKNDPAIQAMMSGDTESAVRLWRSREKQGSLIAKHNMAVMYHMYAVDWTLYHVSYDLDPAVEGEIKGYWKKAFERWEVLVDSDEIRDILKQRIRTLDDEALTTGFVRRFITQLPQALDKINAEAALKLAERNRMDWARFHVDFMRETHQGLDDVDSTAEMVLAPTKARVEQHLSSFEKQADAEPQKGAALARQLLDRCRPMMNLFDLFHGKDAHQRNDLFDRVAETLINMIVDYQRATSDNKTFLSLLNDALNFATSPVLRERIIKNIAIAEGNLREDAIVPIFERLKSVQESGKDPKTKLLMMQQQVLPLLPEVTSKLRDEKELLNQIYDSLAIVLRNISIDAHNMSHDMATSQTAILLAQKLVKKADLRERINQDILQLNANINIAKSNALLTASASKSSSGCLVLFLLPGVVGVSIVAHVLGQIV